MKFVVQLKKAHDRTGFSPYKVAKETGIAINTVRKFAENERVITDQIWSSVLVLARFYGVEWTEVVTVIEDDEDEEEQPLLALGETKLG